MTDLTTFRKIPSAISDLGAAINRIWPLVRRVLTFSLADDLIAPQKNLSASIDLGKVSLAYGSRFLSRITIKGTKEYAFEDDKYPQPEDLLSSLSLTCNEFSAPQSDITLSIPKAWTIIRMVEFPSTVKENISDVISYELDRLTPFTPEDAFFDFRLLEDKGDRISLLLMAAKTDQLRPYLELLKENGFTIGRITVNLSALGTLFSYTDDKSDTIFVEINSSRYEGCLFVNGLPAHNFSGELAGLAEKAKADLISGDIVSMLTMTKHRDRAQQPVALLADNNPAFRELLNTTFGMPVRIMGETDFGLDLPSPQKEMPGAAVGSVLQSLWTEAKGLNLLTKGRYEKQKTPVALTILLMLAIAGIWIFYLVAPLKVEEKRLQEISGQIVLKKEEAKKVEDLKKEAEALREKITAIDNFKHDRIMTLNILRELTSVLPKNAWLSRARVAGTSVDIEGYAGKATELLPKLEASKFFRKVEFASPIMRDQRMDSERFNIKMEIEVTKNNETGNIKNEKK